MLAIFSWGPNFLQLLENIRNCVYLLAAFFLGAAVLDEAGALGFGLVPVEVEVAGAFLGAGLEAETGMWYWAFVLLKLVG